MTPFGVLSELRIPVELFNTFVSSPHIPAVSIILLAPRDDEWYYCIEHWSSTRDCRRSALIVGAGFGGVYQLRRLRQEGHKVKLVDLASDYGGVWYWNRYPGARVDSAIPLYEFSDPEIWREWSWSQRFPGSEELRNYFQFVAEKWDLRRDTYFDTRVTAAEWNDSNSRWLVTTADGKRFKVKQFLLNTGFAAKRHIPDWKGIEKFQGTWVHPSYWPKEEPDLQGKKVAVIGTGSTGVQLAQEISKVAGQFVLFQRTPNLALPMKQIEYVGDEQVFPRDKYSKFFGGGLRSSGVSHSSSSTEPHLTILPSNDKASTNNFGKKATSTSG
ncbi:uncharacterized protein Z519_12421 [Cladophialophora bantiana CBS 173.52]|uniref:FAD/NAD(P)-binding domain-containing protein n=1 Tax=Cladophialophora bantiana (strain ATCC 10958 / CBS 173.52 / CDC B-1940 / NIH 8579) TaxID=1442370 RepID=A0A0D2EA34_CLAB1|nr:uncharacterized protein Z519_12421 [Cladophialophora bantiana CBS 173.52]KIW86956.1 hypothetical protein Z519_12421 [Cladophialophora bantiana CBS 173.52]